MTDAGLVQIEAKRSPHITRSIDNTALDAYMACPRRFLYSMVQNKRHAGNPKAALAYGTTWHTILETHYKTGGDTAAVVEAGVKSWKQHDNPDDHRTIERAFQAYNAYLQRWGNHEEEAKAFGRTVGFPESPIVEQATEIWVPGMLHPYCGKIDRIFEHQGLYYVEDHKTTSQLGTYYFKQFDPSNQMMGYAWLAQKLSGLPIAGVRINAHGVLKTQNKFERQTIMFSQERLREWAENLNSWLQRIEDSMGRLSANELGIDDQADPADAALQAFPHNFNACAGKYGQCVYTEVCTFPPNVRQRVLDSDFDDEPWDPMQEEDGGAE